MQSVPRVVITIVMLLISRTIILNSQRQTCSNVNGHIHQCEVGGLDEFNSSFIIGTRTYMLNIKCSSGWRSNLTSATFKNLHQLRFLGITKCRIYEIQENAFQDLKSLQTLHIWNSPIDVALEKHLFHHTPKVSDLTFKNTNFNPSTNDLLCSLKNLKYLDFYNTNVTQLNMIGCGQNNICCRQLIILRIIENNIKIIGKTEFPFPNLTTLEISYSNVSQIEMETFNNLENMLYLLLNNNKLKTIDQNVFNKNKNLAVIRLDCNKLTHLPKEIFLNLNLLARLNVSNNQLKFNDSSSSLFSKSISLRYLDLSNNNIDYLPKTIFDNLTSLEYLDLSNNILSHINDNHFSRLKSLSLLMLHNNSLIDISVNAFTNLIYLRNFALSENELKIIPNLKFLRNLESIDLSNNLISHIDQDSFLGLGKLNTLTLNENKITKLTKVALNHLQRLRVLNINRNQISDIESGSYIFNNLDLLDLSHNQIREMNSLFQYVQFKLLLNDNQIDRFDFYYINSNIEIVILVRNQLKEITNDKSRQFRLEQFYADGNQLRSFDLNVFPNTMKIISLANNEISQIQMLDYNKKLTLFFINLENNSIAEIDFNHVHISTTQQYFQSKISIELNGNPLACSCLNDWLLDSEKSVALPIIKQSDTCTPIYTRIKKFRNKLNTKTMQQKDLFCKTKYNCPTQCLCFINPKIRLFVIDCFNVTWTNALTNESFLTEPNHTKTVNEVTFFFDANTNVNVVIDSLLAKLTGKLFVGRILYTNNSGLTSIDKIMFQSVPNLIELHLEQNHLSSLTSNEFHFIPKLEKLYLHQNYLQFLSSNTFNHLENLKFLSLHDNRLSQPQLWTMVPYLSQITLSNNLLECDCVFVTQFQKWTGKTHVKDLNDTLCQDILIPIMEYDTLDCFEQPVVAIIMPTVATFVFLTVVVVLMYLYRLEMKVWLYSRHGIRLFYHNQPSDEGKRYDAFISYANEDDEWVVNELAPKLEGYVLCFHQRDFPAGGFIVDSIIESVQNSCRTVIILSPNYINSMWCKFEFDTAHMQSLQDRCKRVVIVILEDVDRSKLDKNLQVYLKTNTYLEKDDSLFWEKLKYALPNLRPRQEQSETSL